MRKLFYPLMLVLAFSLVSFTYANQPETKDNQQTFEIESYDSYDETVNCRWRSCRTVNGVRECDEWTYGQCEKDGNGNLTPIITTEDEG